MKRFFSFIIKQSVAIILIVIFILAFGIYSTSNMAINLLPDINIPMVCVQVIYPGASATSVESDVTIQLEDGLKGISGITDVSSYSYDNLSAVVLSFDYGTDTDEKKTDINNKVNGLSLPDGCTTSVYNIDLNSQALAVLSVTGEGSLDTIYAEAEDIATSLKAIDGVESVDIKGGGDNVIEVVPFKGAELISLLLVEAFSYDALNIPIGNITVDGAEVQIRNNSQIDSLDDIENAAISLPATFVEKVKAQKEAILPQLKDFISGATADQLTLTKSQVKLLLSMTPSASTMTDEQLAAYYASTSYGEQYPILTNPYFIAIARSSDFDNVMTSLAAARPNLSTPVTDEEFTSLLQGLEFNDSSLKLLNFVLKTNLDNLTTNSDGEQVLVVKVSDVATVTKVKQFSSYAYYFDGKMNDIGQSVIIQVYKSNGANSSAVVSSVKSVYQSAQKQAAADGIEISVKLTDDQSQFISDSISNVLISMIIGGVLAIAVIFIFLKKVRLSLIIAVTMPLSVLAALICMYAMGITLNMVSLGGLAVGIGMLVDNSIVIIECISKHRDMGKTAYRAAVDGTCEVGSALIGSTLTTVCVFIPIIFSGGLTGEIFTDLAWAVIFSLTFSLLIAVTVIPALYSMLGGGDKQLINSDKPVSPLPEAETKAAVATDCKACEGQVTAEDVEKKEGNGKGIMQKLKTPYVMRATEKGYRKILPKVLSKRIITVLSAIVIFAASVFLVTLTGTEFLPSIDKGQIEVNMSYGSNAQIEDVQENVLGFSEVIKKEVGDVSFLSVSVGKNGMLALTDTGIITVQLKSNDHTDEAVSKIRKLANTYKGDGSVLRSVTVRQIDGVVASLTSGSNDLSVAIMGKDTEVLRSIASDISAELEKDGYVDITNSLTEKSTEYTFDFDSSAIAKYGLDYQTVVMTLRVGIASYTACTVEIDGESYSLNVRFDDSVFEDGESLPAIQKLAEFVVGYDGSGQAVALSNILDKTPRSQNSGESDEDYEAYKTNKQSYGIGVEKTDACIRRSNGLNTVTISAAKEGVDSGTAGNRMQAIAKQVLSKKEYSGYTFQSSGISSYLTDAFKGLAIALVISLFLLYAVMAVQFSSFVKPLIIMASIPFSFTGGFIALVITGTSLNVVSFIGLIMLMGVIVNNAIVMLEKIKQLHDGGMAHYDAVQAACAERLRPILMTTLTTILALVPMAIGIGQGSELMQPLGIVVIGGLLIGTLVTLILVPAVYCLVYRLSAKYPEGKGKNKGSKAETVGETADESLSVNVDGEEVNEDKNLGNETQN